MGSKWIKHDSIASTSSHLSDLLMDHSLEEGTIVSADYQEAGRGLGDHSWHSNRGENLLMSIVLFPAFLSASSQFHLSRVVSLALCDALDRLGTHAMIKWPNDILSTKGKIAGILIEHSIVSGTIARTIAGIGLNLNQTDFPPFVLPATSYRLETGACADVYQAGTLVENCLNDRYRALREGRTGQLEMDYLNLLYKAGVPALFTSDGEVFNGIIRGVNDFGELEVEHRGRIRTFGYGSISMELGFDLD